MFKGSIVAVVTPFNEDLSINYDTLRELLNWHVENKTDGIVILGTTGESPTLSHDEKIEVFRFTVEVINKRIPVIAGTGSNDTLQTISFSQEVERLGVDGLLIVTPYYNKSNEKGYINHFTKIADSVHTPIILYNVPGRTGGSLSVNVVKELSSHKNIVGIKEASGDLGYVAKVASATPEDFLLFSGNDDVVLPVLSLGGHGVISVAANVIPEVIHNMVDFYLKGNLKEATKLQLEYLDLINSLFIETNPIPVKEMLAQLGLIKAIFRAPLYEISEENRVVIKNIVKRYF